ncbi:MAG: hypothetical protein ACP5DZ_04890, partial [Bacteroidales bacterium]
CIKYLIINLVYNLEFETIFPTRTCLLQATMVCVVSAFLPAVSHRIKMLQKRQAGAIFSW